MGREACTLYLCTFCTSYLQQAHFVHQLDDPSLVGTTASLAVIAVMYEASDECNADLEPFWDELPMVTLTGEGRC